MSAKEEAEAARRAFEEEAKRLRLEYMERIKERIRIGVFVLIISTIMLAWLFG